MSVTVLCCVKEDLLGIANLNLGDRISNIHNFLSICVLCISVMEEMFWVKQ